MGVIKRADLDDYARDAVPLDLSDVVRRAEAIVQAAQSEAHRIIEDARFERDKLIGSATLEGTKRGREQGRAEGLEIGKEAGEAAARAELSERLDAIERSWIEALGQWESSRSELMSSAKAEVVELAAQIAARVLKRTVELDPEVVVDQLESILETLVVPTDLRIHAHPDDIELLERSLPSLIERCANCTHAKLVPDPALAPGSCVARTQGGGGIDASLKKQLDRVVAALMPAHRGPDYDELVDDDEEQGGEEQAA